MRYLFWQAGSRLIESQYNFSRPPIRADLLHTQPSCPRRALAATDPSSA